MSCKQNWMNINLILANKLAKIVSVILFQFSMWTMNKSINLLALPVCPVWWLELKCWTLLISMKIGYLCAQTSCEYSLNLWIIVVVCFFANAKYTSAHSFQFSLPNIKYKHWPYSKVESGRNISFVALHHTFGSNN